MRPLRTIVYVMSIVGACFSCAEARDLMDIVGVNSSIDNAAAQHITAVNRRILQTTALVGVAHL
jgi:hypothetical protein